MRALVTGANGFVGSHLSDLLSAEGWEVVAAVRRGRGMRWLDGKRLRIARVDYAAPESLDEALAGVTHVFHVAGVISTPRREEYWRGNWLTTRAMLAAARRQGRVQRFVHVSSLAATGPSRDGRPVDETTPCRPVSEYGVTKLRGEREVTQDNVPYTVVRPPVVFGPRDNGLLTLLKVISTGFAPRLLGPRAVSFVSVFDLVRALVQVAREPAAAGRVYFVADENYLPTEAWLERIARALGKRPRWIRLPPGVLASVMGAIGMLARPFGGSGLMNRDKAREAVEPYWICSPARIREEIGFQAQVPFDDGMRETIQWYRREGFL